MLRLALASAPTEVVQGEIIMVASPSGPIPRSCSKVLILGKSPDMKWLYRYPSPHIPIEKGLLSTQIRESTLWKYRSMKESKWQTCSPIFHIIGATLWTGLTNPVHPRCDHQPNILMWRINQPQALFVCRSRGKLFFFCRLAARSYNENGRLLSRVVFLGGSHHEPTKNGGLYII